MTKSSSLERGDANRLVFPMPIPAETADVDVAGVLNALESPVLELELAIAPLETVVTSLRH